MELHSVVHITILFSASSACTVVFVEFNYKEKHIT